MEGNAVSAGHSLWVKLGLFSHADAELLVSALEYPVTPSDLPHLSHQDKKIQTKNTPQNNAGR